MEHERVAGRVNHGDPFWPAQAAVALAIALNVAFLSEKVAIKPVWLLPAVEAVLLVALVIVVPARATQHSRGRRTFSLVVVGLVSLTNIVSLARLINYLVSGGHANGRALIVSGAVLWATSVLLFAVWYWEMDRGGPVSRHLRPDAMADFQFPQMENPTLAPAGWRPGFGDYLYVSLTNATAFSPTDTMPLTQTAKLVMGLQSVSALATIGLVVARAVNILG